MSSLGPQTPERSLISKPQRREAPELPELGHTSTTGGASRASRPYVQRHEDCRYGSRCVGALGYSTEGCRRSGGRRVLGRIRVRGETQLVALALADRASSDDRIPHHSYFRCTANTNPHRRLYRPGTKTSRRRLSWVKHNTSEAGLPRPTVPLGSRIDSGPRTRRLSSHRPSRCPGKFPSGWFPRLRAVPGEAILHREVWSRQEGSATRGWVAYEYRM